MEALLSRLKKTCDKWLKENRLLLNDVKIETTVNSDATLVVYLTFKNCLGQIIVEGDSMNTPYKYLSLVAYSIESQNTMNDDSDLCYFFYDSDETKLKKIEEKLNQFITFSLKYYPNMLWNRYVGRKGKLKSTTDLKAIFHIDDSDMIEKIKIDEEFTCIDIFAQYLVLKNNGELQFRIEYQYFILRKEQA